jgi:hypothetical protein
MAQAKQVRYRSAITGEQAKNKLNLTSVDTKKGLK